MKYCEKCLAKNGNSDFFVMMLQTSCAFCHRERVTLQTSCGAEGVNGGKVMSKVMLKMKSPVHKANDLDTVLFMLLSLLLLYFGVAASSDD